MELSGVSLYCGKWEEKVIFCWLRASLLHFATGTIFKLCRGGLAIDRPAPFTPAGVCFCSLAPITLLVIPVYTSPFDLFFFLKKVSFLQFNCYPFFQRC